MRPSSTRERFANSSHAHFRASTALLIAASVLAIVLLALPLSVQAQANSVDVRPASDRTVTLSTKSDSDGDRVVDAKDMCPGTPEGWSVKHNGCPVYQKTALATTVAADGSVLNGVSKIALNSDILFATASDRITPQGASILTRFAGELKAAPSPPGFKREIRLAGYADLTGRWTANLALSQRRADSVRLHLMEQGIPAGSMTAVGYGSAAPVVQCPDTGIRAELAACLAPNRRVEIEVKLVPDAR